VLLLFKFKKLPNAQQDTFPPDLELFACNITTAGSQASN